MIERMRDRCARFCGAEGADCFASSPRQLACIADLVINRTGAISMLLGRRIERPDAPEELIRAAFRDTNELTNYFQYLMMVNDLRELYGLVLDSDLNEKRSELRYPMPRGHAESVAVRADSLGGGGMRIVNYSQSGLRFITPQALDTGAMVRCELGRVDQGASYIGFEAEVRNCAAGPSGMLSIGARIRDVAGRRSFNFFSLVHSMFSGPEVF